MPDLLFLSHRVPYPPDKGDKIRAWHLLQHLARFYRIHLGCLIDDPQDREHLGELRRICERVGGFDVHPALQKIRAVAGMRRGKPLTADVFFHPGLAQWVADSLSAHHIDAVFMFSSGMARYAEGRPGPLRILDMVDVDSEKWREYADYHHWPLRALYRREAATLLALERRAALEFDATLFVSQAEARHFAALAPECRDKIAWVENGVDADRFSPAHLFARPFPADTVNLVFTGTMDYWPNADAVEWFARQVMPLLAGRQPEVQFHIVGARPSRAVRRLAHLPHVHVTGRVPDVRPFIAHADAVVAPLRVARGIQNKVLEAMAMARPVVATPEAFAGLRARPGRDLLVCATPGEMARRLLDIIEGRYAGLGAAARAVVQHDYSWCQTLQRLDGFLAPPLCSAVRAQA
ncbi:MAG TPA: TIGR03087 family PEP-CTERM/XrtA system glycosyltransferase [Stellaceae bacterium]|nr:TIGR03087 family PEP-CTERM/XrtA system glycosyltransferase [Stellaceae bacterium]